MTQNLKEQCTNDTKISQGTQRVRMIGLLGCKAVPVVKGSVSGPEKSGTGVNFISISLDNLLAVSGQVFSVLIYS